ncbi:NAD(P)-dependent dehydrogenase (short-subunit alcohol dehydrogenase family) [Microbacterium murale]|uniref:NAD(P)-dependent dehydrogenase (Short-subunit alcohol dehydrogenase family) n=1 Tax=Microbacterium murale TaxID=1081040 RepID=A0ABU0PDN5_9MICO|nr:NAD(P)-dependent dehydrogenase (short-subunit alcohol dehydrogenase family) [Microbacterium murale]
MSDVLPAGSLAGKVALVTGSSRGIGADTVRYFAEAGADVVINFRNKAPRAEKLAVQLRELGGRALVVGADLTDPASVADMFEKVRNEYGSLDVLVLNASGGMESGMAEDYALTLNRDAQLSVLNAALPLLGEGSRVVFVTSHQAHFIRSTPTMPEYEPVARSKRAGEDALRELIPTLEEKGIGFTVVSGDMIEGTITRDTARACEPGSDRRAPRISGKALQRLGVRRRGRACRRGPRAGGQHAAGRRHERLHRRVTSTTTKRPPFCVCRTAAVDV